ncbi:RNH70 RNA exonuclease 1 [Candida maltosa Xu316]
MNPDVEVGDPLSNSTARLSICQADIDNMGDDNPRLQVKELLRKEGNVSRRDSAVSLNSFVEDDQAKKLTEKRRRSSVQSFNTTQQQPPKREKIHKRKLKKISQPPSLLLQLDKYKNDAKKDQNNDEGDHVRFPFKNLRSLVLDVFKASPGTRLKWCSVGNGEKIPTVCVCFVPGLQLEQDAKDDMEQQKPISNLKKFDELPFIYDTFPTYIRTLSPGNKDSIHSPLQTITNVPLTKNEKKTLLDQSKTDKITIRDLLLSQRDLEEHNYPLQLSNDLWEETQPPSTPGESHIYALDCEFCKAGNIHVLTHFNGEVVFDELVQPAEEITDYVTRYSGITEELLEGVTTTISDIQQLFLEKVSSEDILVGHSLESDLHVMKIKHTKVVDTAVVFEHNRGPPSKPSLRWLADKYLGRSIQCGEDKGEGHSSIEDARACLDLVKKKIVEGKLFGKNVGEVPIFQKLTKNPNYSGDFKSLWLGYSQVKEQASLNEAMNLTKLNLKSDDEIVENFVKEIPSKKFAVVTLRDLEFNSQWGNSPEYYTGDLDYDIEKSMKRTNDRLAKMYEALPDYSLFICYSQSGDPREMFRLQTVRRNYQRLEKEGYDVTQLSSEENWPFSKKELLMEKTALARESLTFIKLKVPEN